MMRRIIAIDNEGTKLQIAVFIGNRQESLYTPDETDELRETNADCVVCPGLMGKPSAQGAYRLNATLMESVDDMGLGKRINDTARYAYELGRSLSIEAFALTACNVALGRTYCATGLKDVARQARFDAARIEAIAGSALCDPVGADYIVIDVANETTVAAYRGAELAFVNDVAALEGPMGLVSAGDLPLQDIVDIAKSGATIEMLREQLGEKSGLLGLCGRKCIADFNDEPLSKAFAYTVAKWAGKAYMALNGRADAVIICCASDLLTNAITGYVAHMGNVLVMKDAELLKHIGRRAELLGTSFLPIRN